MNNILDSRIVGSTNISIGTHLALETLFSEEIGIYDNQRDFTKDNPDEYKYHIYNLYTIIRNILNSCSIKDTDDILRNKKFKTVLEHEVQSISDLYKNTTCKPILFYPDYSKIYKHYNTGFGKQGLTKAYQEHIMVRDTLKDMKKSIRSINDGKGYKIPKIDLSPSDKILITTNIPCDLFNKHNLYLLESHTGKIKNSYEFNTKYHKLGSQDLTNMPFKEELMYILGDRNIVSPLSIKIRSSLSNISKQCGWTPRTTIDKILLDLRLNDLNLHKIVLNFKRLYS